MDIVGIARIIVLILGVVCSDNSNDQPSDILDGKLQTERTVFGTRPKDKARPQSVKRIRAFLKQPLNFKKKIGDLFSGNVTKKLNSYTLITAREPRKRRGNNEASKKRKRTSLKRNNGTAFLSRLTSSVHYQKARYKLGKTKDFCYIDSKISFYTLKIFPRPLEYERMILKNAHARKALCLDGSPAVYFIRKAMTSSKWIIFLPGGAWCSSKETCFARSQTDLGSSKYFPSLAKNAGILSSHRSKNPYFYDWNILYLQYCDGSSFLGNVKQTIVYRKVRLYLRGFQILSTFLDEIVPKYLSKLKAHEVVVVGNSASALGLMINADFILSRIPQNIKVHFVADGGLFVDVPFRNRQHVFSRYMKGLYDFHNITGALLRDCAASFKKRQEWKCLMPENFLRFTKSPIGIINSLTDAWQLVNLKGAKCGYAPRSCNSYEFGLAQQLRSSLRKFFNSIKQMKNLSFFLFSCIKHCTITDNQPWRFLKIGSLAMQDFVYDFVKNEKNVLVSDKNPNPKENPACSSFIS